MNILVATVLILIAVIFTISHLLFRYAPREWIFKIKEPITIHHKRHKNGAFVFPPFHYLNSNGNKLKYAYLGSLFIGFTVLIITFISNEITGSS